MVTNKRPADPATPALYEDVEDTLHNLALELEAALSAAPTLLDEGGQKLTGECDGCGGTHEATYSHEGRFGEGPVYAVVCPADHLTTYVTTEGLTR